MNLTDVIHGFPGHNVDPADMIQTMQIMIQMFLNQTTEIDNLKQQTEKDRSTIQMYHKIRWQKRQLLKT